MVSADLDILAANSTKYDKGLPSISSNKILILYMCLIMNYQFFCNILADLLSA